MLPLTPQQFAAAVNRLGLNQSEAAAELGISRQHLSALMHGREPISITLSRALRDLAREKKTAK